MNTVLPADSVIVCLACICMALYVILSLFRYIELAKRKLSKEEVGEHFFHSTCLPTHYCVEY